MMQSLQAVWIWMEPWYSYAAFGLAVLMLLMLAVVGLMARRLKALRRREHLTSELLMRFQPSLGVEKNFNALLELVGTVIDAPVYAFYVVKDKQYLLKAVRHSETDFGKVRPSYSGLAAYKKENYMPPISLQPASIPSKLEIVKEGEVPLLTLPLGGRGAVRIGPVRKVDKSTAAALESIGETMQAMVPEIVLAETMRAQIDVVLASGKALQNISDAAVDPVSTLRLMIGACSRAAGADGGIFFERVPGRAEYRIIAASGADPVIVQELQNDQVTMEELSEQGSKHGYKLIQQSDADYYQLPPYVAAQASAAVCAVSVGGAGTLVLLFSRIAQTADIGLNQLTRVAQELSEIIAAQSPLQHLSKVYVNILKQLARMMDNLNPYTVGYSEQMSRYSIVIAKQLKLPEDEIRDIALAAYLSNIGVLGLSSELYQKEGKYTESEYEMMKLHSEVGASIVSVTTGNKRVASYIMHHHERIDGGGYPTGLRGNDIPMGAKIIAVVQTFLAKINGRRGRDPLPFDQALQMLQSAAGSQLDPTVVAALVGWFQSKRSDPRVAKGALGSCWDMCCTPSSICEHCPVYRSKSQDKMCWEHETNLCNQHGKSCETCFVRTEYMTRKETKKIG
ncbi:HD-GYP domain-containing protein [Paenibacillus chartarius]|uniref:HD-GYP domain-containing protein n=1 Tax=Paenibacillus chartarius TaxID=747481 RepID=A0ABV6DRA5_9BACL